MPPTYQAATVRLRNYLNALLRDGVSMSEIARRAGLPKNTVITLIGNDLRGHVSTLIALERLIPPDPGRKARAKDAA